MTAPAPNFARSAVATSVANAAVLALSLLTSILVARVLGPDGKGAYTLVLLYASIFVFASTLGLHQAAAFFLGRREYSPDEVFGHTLLYLAGLAVAATAAAAVLRPLLAATIFPGVPARWLVFAIPLIVGQLAFGFLAFILLGLQEIAGYNLVQVLRGMVLLLIAAPALLTGYGVAGVLTAEFASFLIVAGLAFLLAIRRIRGISTRFNQRYVRASLRYGLAVYSGTALSFFHYRTALLLLSAFTTPAVVGLYSVAAGLAGNLSLISQGAATVLFPRISSDPAAARDTELTPLVLRTVLLVSGTAAGVLAVAGPWLIMGIFTDAFAGSVGALQILLPGAVALCVWSILDSYFKGTGRPVWSTLTTGLAVVVGAALSVWWIPRYGLRGASAASSVAYILSLIVALTAYTRFSGLPLRTVLVPRRADVPLYRGIVIRLLGARGGEGPVRPEATGGGTL